MFDFTYSYDLILSSCFLYSCSETSRYSVEIVKYPIEKCKICLIMQRVLTATPSKLSPEYYVGSISITSLIE